jgi:excisionase family DNA binding protein
MRLEKQMIGAKNMQTIEKQFLSTKDVARLFSVSYQTVRSWFKTGQLPYVQIGMTIRVKREDVQAFIDRNAREREAVAQ